MFSVVHVCNAPKHKATLPVHLMTRHQGAVRTLLHALLPLPKHKSVRQTPRLRFSKRNVSDEAEHAYPSVTRVAHVGGHLRRRRRPISRTESTVVKNGMTGKHTNKAVRDLRPALPRSVSPRPPRLRKYKNIKND